MEQEPSKAVPTQYMENEIRHCAEMVWTTTLGLSLKPKETHQPIAEIKNLRCATQFKGRWNGWLVITIAPGLTHTASRIFFGESDTGTENENIEDTLKELANQIGGNLKNLVPQPSFIDIPVMSFEACELKFPQAEPLTRLTYECEGDLVEFQLLEFPEKN